jgi:hypothetical protein
MSKEENGALCSVKLRMLRNYGVVTNNPVIMPLTSFGGGSRESVEDTMSDANPMDLRHMWNLSGNRSRIPYYSSRR